MCVCVSMRDLLLQFCVRRATMGRDITLCFVLTGAVQQRLCLLLQSFWVHIKYAVIIQKNTQQHTKMLTLSVKLVYVGKNGEYTHAGLKLSKLYWTEKRQMANMTKDAPCFEEYKCVLLQNLVLQGTFLMLNVVYAQAAVQDYFIFWPYKILI